MTRRKRISDSDDQPVADALTTPESDPFLSEPQVEELEQAHAEESKDDASAEQPTATQPSRAFSITALELAEILAMKNPDLPRFDRAIELAFDLAAGFYGRKLPRRVPHNVAQGIRNIALNLIFTRPDLSPAAIQAQPLREVDIPLVARFHLSLGRSEF